MKCPSCGEEMVEDEYYEDDMVCTNCGHLSPTDDEDDNEEDFYETYGDDDHVDMDEDEDEDEDD